MKSLFKKSIVFLFAFSAVSCFEDSDRNYQYMPDMYESVPYDAYGEYDVFANGQEAKLPVEFTVPRGWKPYPYENSNEGYLTAKAELENPLPYTEDNLAAGRELYTIYCAVCHGDTGDGQGILVEREKFLGIPSYIAPGRDITDGSAYHVMYYGRNAMGSYASQTSIEERWQIAHYVMQLKDQLLGNPERETVDEDGEEEGAESLIPAINADGQVISAETSISGPGEGDDQGEENQNEE